MNEWSHELMLPHFIKSKTLCLSHIVKLTDFGEHIYYVNVHISER